MTAYTAASIRILHPDEAEARFGWAAANRLAARYQRPVEWVERGLAACYQIHGNTDYFIARYLEGDKSIPRDIEVETAFIEALRSHT